MKTIEQVVEEWKTDCYIDKSSLDAESLKTYELHSKYTNYLIIFQSELRKTISKINIEEKERSEFYRGIGSKNKIDGKSCYDIKVPKTDLPLYLKADEIINNLTSKKQELEASIEVVKEIIKMINNRGFAIKNSIEWARFQNGLN